MITRSQSNRAIVAKIRAIDGTITTTQMSIFGRLLDYCCKYGSVCEEGVSITLGHSELSMALNVPPRTLTNCLSKFAEDGIIIRRGMHPKPFETIIPNEFL